MTLMDLMLSMAEDFHHDLLWRDRVLEEWARPAPPVAVSIARSSDA